MRKYTIFIVFILFLINVSRASAQSAPQLSIIDTIDQGKILLNSIKLNYDLSPQYTNKTTGKGKSKKTTKTLTGYKLNSKELAVAIYNPQTQNTVITKAIQVDKKFTFPDKSFDIKLVRFNGVNSLFEVNKPAGGFVVALKYLITGPESGSKDAITSQMKEAIYVPYSSKLNTLETTKYGEQYLDSVINDAKNVLQNIPSASQPGVPVSGAISSDVVKALLYSEHTESAEVLNNNASSAKDKVNVLFAGNKADTYKYSISAAAASGLSQFIPSTYATLVTRHKDVGLISDFVQGMADHKNAVIATYLLLDDYIAVIKNQVGTNIDPNLSFEYGVAAYNGGTSRVIRAINNFGVNWSEDNSFRITDIQNQINELNKNIVAIKASLKKAAAADKANLQIQLDIVNASVNQLQSQIETYKNANLRGETMAYVKKIRALLPVSLVQTASQSTNLIK